MRPTPARFDAGYLVLTNPVGERYFALQSAICANLENLRLCEFSAWRLFAKQNGSVFIFITNIFAVRIPTQVMKAIVPGISIIVAAHHAVRAWANESGKHHAMKFRVLRSLVRMKLDADSPVLFARQETFHSTSSQRPNAPAIRNLIENLVAGNRHPLFRGVCIHMHDYGRMMVAR